MRIIFLVLLALLLEAPVVLSDSWTPVREWQLIETRVRDCTVPYKEANERIPGIMDRIIQYALSRYRFRAGDWQFPVQGYDRHSMLKNDFKPGSRYGPFGIKGYDFFDGNKHGGHPAHDLFVLDRNRDLVDDRTRKPIELVALNDAIVLSTYKNWVKGSILRGGNYVWMFNPLERKFYYYAHMNKIFVEPGQFVVRGEPLGTMGRTGKLASRRSSPTHLHLMVIDYSDGKFRPCDYYGQFAPVAPKKHPARKIFNTLK